MILGHRVPVTLDECLNIGCDVETWVKEGYADYLLPMDFLMNDLNLRTDEFVKVGGGTQCLVYPAFRQDAVQLRAVVLAPASETVGGRLCVLMTSSGRPQPTGTPGQPRAGHATTCTCGRRESGVLHRG